jgi:hypothetical protein
VREPLSWNETLEVGEGMVRGKIELLGVGIPDLYKKNVSSRFARTDRVFSMVLSSQFAILDQSLCAGEERDETSASREGSDEMKKES